MQLMLVELDMPSLELNEIILGLVREIEDAETYDESESIVPPAPRPQILDVASALNLLGTVQFEHEFGLNTRFALRLSRLLFGDMMLTSKRRHGSIGGELTLFVVMPRFRGNITMTQGLSYLFGFGEGKISDFLRLSCQYIYDRFKHLLALPNLVRFAPLTRGWGEVMERKYVALANNANVTQFSDRF